MLVSLGTSLLTVAPPGGWFVTFWPQTFILHKVSCRGGPKRSGIDDLARIISFTKLSYVYWWLFQLYRFWPRAYANSLMFVFFVGGGGGNVGASLQNACPTKGCRKCQQLHEVCETRFCKFQYLTDFMASSYDKTKLPYCHGEKIPRECVWP